ncbi:MAG TPA: hypothetical protein PK156_24110 [Polyangium sp.]|nr:hypothetical protein [Polyangium sp.]
MGAIVSAVAAASRAGAQISELARSFLDLPLLQNAVGMPLTPNAVLHQPMGNVYIYEGKEPQDKDLAPWLDDVVWIRGKMIESIVARWGAQDAKARIAAALAARERRRVMHSRPASQPIVPKDDGHIVQETFRIDIGTLQGLRGQLALGAEGQKTGQRPTTVRVYVEGRHIDTLTIDRDKLPLSMDAAIAWEGRLRPKFSYEGVIDDVHLRLAIFQLTRFALVTLGAYLDQSVQEKRPLEERTRVLPLVRTAIGAYTRAAKTLGVEKIPDEPPLSAYLPIWTRGVWVSANPDRLPISLAELKTYSDRTKTICYVSPGASGIAPDGRPVVVLTDLEKDWIGALFPGVTFVPYERGLRRAGHSPLPDLAWYELVRASPESKLLAGVSLPWMKFETREYRGAITTSTEDRCLSLHAGVMLATDKTNQLVEPAILVVDHDTTVPTPGWDGVLWSRDSSIWIHVRNEFLEKLVLAYEGNHEARNALQNFQVEPGFVVRSFLVEGAARMRTKELGARIEKLALVHMLGADSRPKMVSLAEVAARFPDPQPIPFLRERPQFDTLDWNPLFLENDRELAAFVRWAGNRAKNAVDEVQSRYKVAQAEQVRRDFLRKPIVTVSEPVALADPDRPAQVWQEQPDASGAKVTAVVAALPMAGYEIPLANIEILYEQRLITKRSLLSLPVPVVARVFLPSNQYLVGYYDITSEALTRIEGFVYAAACALAAELVIRAQGPAAEAFFQDRRGLLLIKQLYAVSVTDRSRSDVLVVDFALRASDFSWPTVQNTWCPYAGLVPGSGKLYYGTFRFPDWEKPHRGTSEIDGPIVYLPPTTEGHLVREILGYMGHEMIDVSAALYALQSRRKPGSSHSGPTLLGLPEYPALRVSLSSLGLDVEGELELTDIQGKCIDVETLHGTKFQIAVTGPVPFRATVRVEDVELDANERKKLAEKLAKGALKHLESLGERVVEFPPFIRTALRGVVLKHLRNGKNISKRRRNFEVFQDVLGEYHSLAQLAETGDSPYPFVMSVPTHPISRRPRPPIILTPDEAYALSNVLAVDDVTQRLSREIQAEERKRAAPVSFIGLASTQRLECLDIVPFDGDDIEGEIGLLTPENVDKRGIWVYKNRRSLCKLGDSTGWPVIAVINDDSIPENKTFDGIKGNGAKDKLRKAVRARAEAVIARWCVVPNDALAGKKVRKNLISDSLIIQGAIWLPPSWLSAGSVEVRDASNRFLMPRSFGAPNSPARLDIELPIPVGGRLFVANTGAAKKPQEINAAISTWLLEETTELVLEAVASDADRRMVEGYQWLLRFLGADVGKLEALTGNGQRIDSSEIVETLRTKKEIWISVRDTDVEDGDFPTGTPPPFVLRGEGQALVDVLRARTNAVRELAGRKPAPTVAPKIAAFETDKPAPSAPALAPMPAREQVALPLIVAARLENAPIIESADDEPPKSWFQSVVQRVIVFFDPPAPMEPWTQELGPSLLLAIDKLGLAPTNVVTGVRYVRRGRPMVFEEASGRLVINRSHPGIRALAVRVSHDSRARLLLVVLAVREINRVLEVVTDATERRVLLSLLRGESL